MKLVFINDNSDLKTVTNTVGRIIECVQLSNHIHVLTVEEQPTYKTRNLYDVAVEVKKCIHEDSIILIDQYLACADKGFEWLRCNSGIALIKFLRMLEVRNHIILISPFAYKTNALGNEPISNRKSKAVVELIRQSTSNLIVASKGISFAKNLHELSGKPIEDFIALCKDRFDDTQNLKPYVLAEFRLPEDERHNWANWWGIDRLWNIHRIVEKEKYGIRERWNLNEYPDGLKDKIKELKNRQALFLYGHQEAVIANRLSEYNTEIAKAADILKNYISARNSFIENRDNIQALIENKAQEIANQESRISYIKFKLPELNGLSHIFKDKRAECVKRIAELYNEITRLEKELNGTDDEIGEKQRIRSIGSSIAEKEQSLAELKALFKEEEEKYLSALQAEIDRLSLLIHKGESKILSLSIPQLRKSLKNTSPKILYIDDQASDGWSNIFQHIIYGKADDDSFIVIQPKDGDKIDSHYFTDFIASKIHAHKPDLILLDLRLLKESGVRIEVDNLSGAFILQEIRKEFSGIPVMMATASNKSWSFEELKQLGCDAFWTKEGVDTGMTEVDSLKNYLRFVELVSILTGYDYKFLSAFATGIKTIQDSKTPWWWESSKYALDNKVDRNELCTTLRQTMFIIQEYLKNEIINPRSREQNTNWLLPSLIIHNIGKIPELIYNTWTVDKMFDKYAKELYGLRNNASHIVQAKGKRTAKEFTFSDAKEECKKMLVYLQLNKKPDIIEFKPVSDATLTISREALIKNIERSRRR